MQTIFEVPMFNFGSMLTKNQKNFVAKLPVHQQQELLDKLKEQKYLKTFVEHSKQVWTSIEKRANEANCEIERILKSCTEDDEAAEFE